MRILSSRFVDVIERGVYHPIKFIELEFRGGVERLHTCGGNIKWKGLLYYGMNDNIDINVSSLVSGSIPQNYSIVLRYNINTISYINKGEYQNRPFKMYSGILDIGYSGTVNTSLRNDPRIVLDPYLMVSGLIDYANIKEDDSNGSIEFFVVNELELLNTKSNYRYTQYHQKRLYPYDNDTGLNMVNEIQNKSMFWELKK